MSDGSYNGIDMEFWLTIPYENIFSSMVFARHGFKNNADRLMCINRDCLYSFKWMHDKGRER